MVKIKDILEKLSPHLSYGEAIMNIELGDVDFDNFKQEGDFFYVFSNSKNPNIRLRIKEDFPFRVVLIKREGNSAYGTTWNGIESITWVEEKEEFVERLFE
ncbi:hypothetical protein [Methanosphaera sp. BMS]|uniref:hypothetical protein n=1 Tax=Methanosphaera sp. BMS TaxID=1789762 RepID=UPI000DC1CE1A|nr:hypothetical protein [Methanosphaera sp. BMS]AWX31841.1 hypothetical protein AW729_01485 [Methanosphaera sp. BMS]